MVPGERGRQERTRRRPRVASPRTPRRAGRGPGKIASGRCSPVRCRWAVRTTITP